MSAKKTYIEELALNGDIPPTFYDKIGDNLIMDLQNLINTVVERYKLLKEIESLTQKRAISAIAQKIPNILKWTDVDTINNDISSHFILALIMCKNEGDARWFIKQESSLYKARLEQSKRYDMYKILSSLGMNLNLFDKNKDKNVDINNIRFKRKEQSDEKIYFCRFEDAINLIATKDYYLYKGNIYILETDLPLLFKLVFEQKQEKVMAKIRANSESIKRDRRIKEIILSFEREKEIYNNQEAAKMAKEIPNDEKLRTMNDVDVVSERCFPLCMSLIERHINQYSHLMHFGRLQYTLFLKGAGLPVEETLKFYQKKYEKKTPLDKFEKEYAYNIRHSYGLEGKRQSYAPFNCEKIINMNVPMGNECHGCPFKNYSEENLRKILNTCNLKDADIEDILNKKKNKEYQVACVKYFEAKFPGTLGEGIGIHPNKYFTSAMKVVKNQQNKKKVNNDNNNDAMDIVDE
jgi:DNA primase large subunit